MLFNGNLAFLHFLSIFHVIQWEFCISSIFQGEAAGRQRRRTEERRKDPERYKLKEITRKQNYRLSQMDTAFKRRKAFLASVNNRRIFFCICCHRKLYDNQVVELDEDWKESFSTQYPGSFEKFIGPIPSQSTFLPCLVGE